MNVVGLDGRECRWRLAGHAPAGDDTRPRSSHHLRARALLRRLYPSDRLLEEVPLPIGHGRTLHADFVLPLRRLVVEVQGEQHYRFVARFHGNALGYLEARGRDVDKRRWCELNGLSLAALPYGEDDDEWQRRIRDAHGGE